MDFGIVKLVHSTTTLTKEGVIIGTTAYMAPEQWRGDPLTPALDQYALAVLMYLLVTGKLPFDSPTSHEFMYKHLHEIPPLAHTQRQGVPESVSNVLERALQKEPENRYPDVIAFSDVFSEAVQGWEGQPTGFFTSSLAPGPVPMLPVVPENNGVETSWFEPDSPVVEPMPTPLRAPYPPPTVNPPPAVYAAPAPVRRKTNPALPLLVGLGIVRWRWSYSACWRCLSCPFSRATSRTHPVQPSYPGEKQRRTRQPTNQAKRRSRPPQS